MSPKTIQGLLEGKQAILKQLDEEFIELYLLEEVEQETVDLEEISEAIIECIEQIKSVIRADVDTHTALTARGSANVSPRDETVHTNNSSKLGAAAVEHTLLESPPRAVDNA